MHKLFKNRLFDFIFSTLIFCLFSGTVIYVYNAVIVNQVSCTAETYWRYLRITVACMLPVFVPLMLYLRQKFGEKIIPLSSNTIVLFGENKNEILQLEKEELLFIKAVENYIEICFIDKNNKIISKNYKNVNIMFYNVDTNLNCVEYEGRNF